MWDVDWMGGLCCGGFGIGVGVWLFLGFRYILYI